MVELVSTFWEKWWKNAKPAVRVVVCGGSPLLMTAVAMETLLQVARAMIQKGPEKT